MRSGSGRGGWRDGVGGGGMKGGGWLGGIFFVTFLFVHEV